MFYLDHEERVKFVDGVLAHSQEWQWLIDIIGEKAEFKDIDSWGDFVNERIQLQTIYEYFCFRQFIIIEALRIYRVFFTHSILPISALYNRCLGACESIKPA